MLEKFNSEQQQRAGLSRRGLLMAGGLAVAGVGADVALGGWPFGRGAEHPGQPDTAELYNTPVTEAINRGEPVWFAPGRAVVTDGGLTIAINNPLLVSELQPAVLGMMYWDKDAGAYRAQLANYQEMTSQGYARFEGEWPVHAQQAIIQPHDASSGLSNLGLDPATHMPLQQSMEDGRVAVGTALSHGGPLQVGFVTPAVA